MEKRLTGVSATIGIGIGLGFCLLLMLGSYKLGEGMIKIKSVVPTVSATTQPSVQEKLDAQALEIKNLEKKLEHVVNTLDYLYWELETEPAFVLRRMDHALDLVERGEQKQKLVRGGSYIDWFLPMIQDLRKMGVPKSVLRKRLDRVIDLAGNGKYYDSSIQETIEREGFYKFSRYTLDNLK